MTNVSKPNKDGDKTELVSKRDVVKLIDELNAISFYEANEHSKECYYDIRNAILAMPGQKPCKDTISRQAAIDAFSMFAEYESNRTNAEWVDRIRVVLSSLPPVQTIRPRGHWIVHPKGIYAHLVCDKCLSNAPYDCKTNYCPDCGCRMVEPQESEE